MDSVLTSLARRADLISGEFASVFGYEAGTPPSEALAFLYAVPADDFSMHPRIAGVRKWLVDHVMVAQYEMTVLHTLLRARIPRCEDGNNFGVDVIDNIRDHVNSDLALLVSWLTNRSACHSTRALHIIEPPSVRADTKRDANGNIISRTIVDNADDGAAYRAERRLALYDDDADRMASLEITAVNTANNIRAIIDKIAKNRKHIDAPRGNANVAMHS